MNLSKSKIRILLLTLFLAVGLSAGSFLNSEAQTGATQCGFCDHSSSVGSGIDMEFCNFTIPQLYNGCGGNHGYDNNACNPNECSVQLPQIPT